MFDSAIAEAPTLDELRALLPQIAAVDGVGATEAELIDQITAMERLKSGLAAAQARVTATLSVTRRRAEATRGVPASSRCSGLAAEIALARLESPFRGGQHYNLSTALVDDMPETLAALSRGDISEFRAMLIVRETAVLTREDRRQADAELAGRLAGRGDRAAALEARKIGLRLDPDSVRRRTRKARDDRHVGLRPAPDAMGHLTGFLPIEQGAACESALGKHADSLKAKGDERTRAQIMADTMVERLTGQRSADSTHVEIQLVMTEASLLRGDHEPARLAGFGPIPAATARDLVRNAAKAFVRRLFTTPDGQSLVAMETQRRCFEGGLRSFLIARDEVCSSPWCDAPIRHLDHVVRVADGGKTSADNGQGLCVACNYTKEAPGWRAKRPPGTLDLIEITTPTGHRYRSRAPDPPGNRVDTFSPGEQRLRSLLAVA